MNLNIDTTDLQLVQSPTDANRVLAGMVSVGDKIPITLAFLQRNPAPLNTGLPLYVYQDMSAASIVISIGPGALPPTAGSFVLTFGANATPALPWNIGPIDLGTALNALASIVTAGGVTVTGPIGGPFVVSFITFGVQAAITCSINSLFPNTGVTIATTQVGTAALAAVQVFTMLQADTVQVSAWTPQVAAAIVVTSIQGTVIQRVAIPSGTYGGSFTLTLNGNTTAAIPFAAQMDVVAAAINSLPGVAGATVWPGQNYWDITIPANAFAITGSATGLIIPLTLSGTLDLTAQAVADLLAGQPTAIVPIAIQATAGGNIITYFSGTIQLNQVP